MVGAVGHFTLQPMHIWPIQIPWYRGLPGNLKGSKIESRGGLGASAEGFP